MEANLIKAYRLVNWSFIGGGAAYFLSNGLTYGGVTDLQTYSIYGFYFIAHLFMMFSGYKLASSLGYSKLGITFWTMGSFTLLGIVVISLIASKELKEKNIKAGLFF